MSASTSSSTAINLLYDSTIESLREIDFQRPLEEIVGPVFKKSFRAFSVDVGNQLFKHVEATLNLTTLGPAQAAHVTAVLTAALALHERGLCDADLELECAQLAHKVIQESYQARESAEPLHSAIHAAKELSYALYVHRQLGMVQENKFKPHGSSSPGCTLTRYEWLKKSRQKAHLLVQDTLEVFLSRAERLQANTLTFTCLPELVERWRKFLDGELAYDTHQRFCFDLGKVSSRMGIMVDHTATSSKAINRATLILQGQGQHNIQHGGPVVCVQLKHVITGNIWAVCKRYVRWITRLPADIDQSRKLVAWMQSHALGGVYNLQISSIEGHSKKTASLILGPTFDSFLIDDKAQWNKICLNKLISSNGYENLITDEVIKIVELLKSLHDSGYSHNAISPHAVGRLLLHNRVSSSSQSHVQHAWTTLNTAFHSETWYRLSVMLRNFQRLTQNRLLNTPVDAELDYNDQISKISNEWFECLGVEPVRSQDPFELAFAMLGALPAWPVSPCTAPEIQAYLSSLKLAKQSLNSRTKLHLFFDLALPSNIPVADIWSLGALLYLHLKLDLNHSHNESAPYSREHLYTQNEHQALLRKICNGMLQSEPSRRPTIQKILKQVQSIHNDNVELGNQLACYNTSAE